MKRNAQRFNLPLLISFGVMAFLPTACMSEYPESCPSNTPVGLLEADEISSNDNLPFRFPLEETAMDNTLYFGWFSVSNECPPDKPDCYEFPVRKFHAAEDYKRPPGTSVYAMADGQISFSGRAGGYGWLIIIDHPQANLYSLYGHLSPSRWKQAAGTDVKRGDLIAYLGDPDENGGSEKNPLDPHLHFGLRAGQTLDYPGKGEWRFMAGWIRLCPQDLGWLQPSLVITSQAIPAGGYPQPEVNFLTRWGLETLVICAYGFGGGVMLIQGIKKKSIFSLLFPGPVLILASILFYREHMVSTYALLGVAIVVMTCGVYVYTRHPKQKGQG